MEQQHGTVNTKLDLNMDSACRALCLQDVDGHLIEKVLGQIRIRQMGVAPKFVDWDSHILLMCSLCSKTLLLGSFFLHWFFVSKNQTGFT